MSSPDYRAVYACRDFWESVIPKEPSEMRLFGTHWCTGPCGKKFSEGELVEGYAGFVCHPCLEHDGSLAPPPA